MNQLLDMLQTMPLGMAALWLIRITIYPASALGIVIYLTINLAFGLMNHLGVEPLPGAWLTIPLIRQISTSLSRRAPPRQGAQLRILYAHLGSPVQDALAYLSARFCWRADSGRIDCQGE